MLFRYIRGIPKRFEDLYYILIPLFPRYLRIYPLRKPLLLSLFLGIIDYLKVYRNIK
jgi:hypothetical protein